MQYLGLFRSPLRPLSLPCAPVLEGMRAEWHLQISFLSGSKSAFGSLFEKLALKPFWVAGLPTQYRLFARHRFFGARASYPTSPFRVSGLPPNISFSNLGEGFGLLMYNPLRFQGFPLKHFLGSRARRVFLGLEAFLQHLLFRP